MRADLLIQQYRGLQSGTFFFLQAIMPDKFRKKKKGYCDLNSDFLHLNTENNKQPYKKNTAYFYMNK